MATRWGVRNTVDMNAAARKPDRTLTVILAVIALLVVVALAVVFSRGTAPLLDESTPQGVVQRYTAAVIEGDEATAATYLTEAARSQCINFESPFTNKLRVTLVSTTERPASADVKVLITVSNGGGPFGSSEYETEDVFDLVKTNGRWLVDSAPYQLRVCPNKAVTK